MMLKQIGIVLVLLVVANSWEMGRMLQKDGFSDPLCAIFDQQTGDCVACICRGYFDKNRQCRPVSDLCQRWNINTGECLSCYRGYQLVNSTCITIPVYIPGEDENTVIDNPNCKTDDGNGTCLSCRPYYIKYCGDCQTTGENPFCSKFDSDNICVECDTGYELDANNVCQDPSQIDLPGNQTNCSSFPNCLQCNATECTKCDDGYRQQYYSRECVLPIENCTQGCATCSPNQSHECFSCEAGYSAQSWPICIYCSYMYSRNSQGKCVPILSDCSAFPNCRFCVVGQCSACETGYTLNDKQQCVKN